MYRLFVVAAVLVGLACPVVAQTAADADFDGNGIVDIPDFLLFVDHFGSSRGDGTYEAKYDLDSNGVVGIPDFLIFVDFFGQTARLNQLPIAHAGEDQSVDKRETVTLDGANSSDPEGQRLTFTWRQVGGEFVALSQVTVTQPTFRAQRPGTYLFQLVVHDGQDASLPDTVRVEVVSISDAVVKVGVPDGSLMHQTTTGDQITFSVQGTAPRVQVGDVMVNTVEPYFLKKVVSVSRQDAREVVVMTRDAALTEVIEDASISRTFGFPATKLALANSTIQDPITLYNDASARLRVTTCDISFSPEYEFKMNIEGSKLDSLKVGVNGDLVVTLEMSLEAFRAFILNADQSVAQVTNYAFFAVGGIPVVVEVKVEFGVGADFSAEFDGRIISGITMTKPVEVGTIYKDGSWQNLTGGSEATYKELDSTVELQGAATIRGYIRGQVDFNLFAIAGPYFGVKPYLDFAAETNQAQSRIDWSLHAGVDGYAGVQAAIFDKIGLGENFAAVSWDFNFFEYPLKTGILALSNQEVYSLYSRSLSVAFSPDGRYIATGDDEGDMGLWEVSSGTILWWKSLGGKVASVAFSSDGRYLAADGVGSSEPHVVLLDVSSGTEIQRTGVGASSSDADRVNSVAFSPDGNYVAIGVDLRWAWLWDLNSDRRNGWGERDASEVYAVAFSPDGRYLATGDDAGYAILWEVSSWWTDDVNSQYMDTGSTTNSQVLAVAFSPDGQYLATDGYDGSNTSVIIWDVRSGTRVRRLSAGNVFAIAFRPDGRYLAAGDDDGIITFWRTDSWLREKQIRTGATVTDLAWSPGGNLISDGKKVYRPLLLR